MEIEKFKAQITNYALHNTPFIFIIDYENKNPIVHTLKNAQKHGILFDIKGISNISKRKIDKKLQLTKYPFEKVKYAKQFNKIKQELNHGNTYLTNLTVKTKIDINLTLEEIFHLSDAPYKLLFKNRFVIFSPECFIETVHNDIFAYPMKGTIDASIDNAANILLSNKKEEWEHNTIIDLLRNDISMVAQNITVEEYRYIEKIKTHHNELFQTSSKIKGILDENWRNTLGETLFKLLPAGSISGAPKKRTLDIIKAVENTPRGYYTGIFGIYDGKNIQSAVSIRYIEKQKNNFYYKSGGGITSKSELYDEYQEVIQKIYVPVI